MANTITLVSQSRGAEQFRGAFSDMWKVRATIDDQDAVAINDTLALSVTVSGIALGDIVLGGSLSLDLSDGTDIAVATYAVTATNTLTVYVQADVGEFAADALNGAIVRCLVARPIW